VWLLRARKAGGIERLPRILMLACSVAALATAAAIALPHRFPEAMSSWSTVNG
jgi:hypothetical protein